MEEVQPKTARVLRRDSWRFALNDLKVPLLRADHREHGCHETNSFSVSRGGRWSRARPVAWEANAPKVSSGISR